MSDNIVPIEIGSNAPTLQGYALGLSEQASTWLSTELANGEFKVPEGYDIKGEVASAMVKLNTMKGASDKSVLEQCTPESVLIFLKDMVTQGLSFTRNQCYAIPYGPELKMNRSYFGTITTIQNMFPKYEITCNVIFDGDSFDYCTDTLGGYNFVDNHKSSFLNRDNGVIGVYGAIVDKETGKRVYAEVMTRKEIDTSWSHAKTSKVQNEFPTEMAKRTLINRMCKKFINSKPTGMTAAQFEAYNRTTEAEYDTITVSEEKPQSGANLKGAKKFDSVMAKRAQEAETATDANAQEIPF